MQRYEKYGILNYLCKVILERMMKKNAIPTCENMVDDHFGHCAYIWFVK